jgi:hypothetical protein
MPAWLICLDCGAVLTDEERRYYGTRCEACECADHDRVEAWRHGAADPELDAMYGAEQAPTN